MVIVMIESPDGIEIADKIAAVAGVDVVFAASGDVFPPSKSSLSLIIKQ
jgi:2-keto-3-deoxy-L-rhamnonate aldolase RhmA